MRWRLLVIGLAVTGCTMTGSGVRPLRPLEIATAAYREGGTASVTGSLLYESSCLLLRNENGTQYYYPVWPYGTIFNGTSVVFHRPGKADARIVLAEESHFTGDVGEWSELDPVTSQRFASQCAARPLFVSTVTPAN